MTGLDDSGMHRADRDLMETRTLGLKKRVGRQRYAWVRRFAQWVMHGPLPMVEPRPRIGKPDKLNAEEIDWAARSKRIAGAWNCASEGLCPRARRWTH